MWSKLKYFTTVFVIVTGLWLIFYLLFSLVLRLFTKNKKIVFGIFLIFTFLNWLIFPAAYYYVYGGVLTAEPIEFLFSLTKSDLLFATGTFLLAGPIGFIINSDVLYDDHLRQVLIYSIYDVAGIPTEEI